MSSWSCVYCTLINNPSDFLCQGCGSQRPETRNKTSPSKSLNMIPKFISDAVKDVSNAVNELISNNSKVPAHNIVRAGDIGNVRTRVPDGPFIDGQSNQRPNYIDGQPSSSTFFVSTPEQPHSYQNVPGESALDTSSSPAMVSVITSKVKYDVQKKNNKVYEDIMEFCRTNNLPFIDDSFPHSKRSIGVLKYKKNGIDYVNEPNFLRWLRPAQMFTKDGRNYKWSVFNNPVPSDIEQGTLVGDCWLMSAMALIAERPDVLDEIFPRKEYSHQGVYQVRVCVEGKWKVVIVDDFFPCYANTNSMGMAIGRRNQLWVPLIEKALAKVMGSYSKLHGASLTQGLSMLTGASCVNYDTTKEPGELDTFWVQLVSSKDAGFLMCCVCGTRNSSSDEEYRAQGLLTNHAYSILDVVSENGAKLLRIRNPWGSFVWNGKWSDNWAHWPAGMRQRLVNSRMGETGAFWMELEDFVKMFTFVTICKLRPLWSELRTTQTIGRQYDPNSKVFQIIVTETCETSFMAFQKGSFKAKDDDVSDMMISVHRITDNGQVGELMGRSPRVADRHVTTDEFFLKPGHYVVLCHSLKLNSNGKNRISVNLVAHSSSPMFGEYIPQSFNMMADALQQIVIKEGEVFRNTENGVMIRTLTNKFRGMVIMADNFLEDRWLHVSVNCSESMNIQSSRGSLHVTDVIPPMSRQIVIVLSTIDDLAEYRISNSLKTLVCRKQYIGKEMHYEAAISNNKLTHYPSIDPVNVMHSTVSVYTGM